MKILTPAALPATLAALALCACSQGGGGQKAGDPSVGLDTEIRTWREAIEASNPLCEAKVEGKGCESFEVVCKGAQELTPADTAKGVTARIVVAMIFQAKAVEGSGGRPGSAFATFTRTPDGWTRAEAKPVNLQTCAVF